jgi:hypothetical protein
MVGRAANGTRQKMGNAFLNNLVLRQTDSVEKNLTFQELIDVRCRKAAQVPFPKTHNERFQNGAAAAGAMSIAGAKGTPLQIT